MTLYISIYRYIDNEEPQNLFIPPFFFFKKSSIISYYILLVIILYIISYYIKGYTLSMGNKIDIVVV